MTATLQPRAVNVAAPVVREARPADNEALLRLCATCTMEGDIGLRIDRAPDFFALNRLEGDVWHVAVVEDPQRHGELLGCAAVALREVWLNGVVRTVCYTSDLKVHPSARRESGGAVADPLMHYIADRCVDWGGPNVPALVTILQGNRRMERRAEGPRGLPVMQRVATVDAMALPLLWERSERVAGLTARTATDADLAAMADFWTAEAPSRQFADAWDADRLRRWIQAAPGLSIDDYLIVLDARGRIRAFAGIWDQSSIKQLRIVSYSPRLAFVRRAVNVAARTIGATTLPSAGGELPTLALVHVCAADPSALRALLLEAYRRHRGRGRALMTFGLDSRDPLVPATRGLLMQSTKVGAYVAAKRPARPFELDGRPLRLETSLT